MTQSFRNLTNIQRKLMLLSATLLFALQGAGANTIYIQNGGGTDIYQANATDTEIMVSAVSSEADFNGTLEIFAPKGCYLRTWGSVTKGKLTLGCNLSYQKVFTSQNPNEFTNIWANELLSFTAESEGGGVDMNATVMVIDPQNIRNEKELKAILAFYDEYGKLQLKLGADINLTGQCQVPMEVNDQDTGHRIDVEIDLNGHKLYRDLSAATNDGNLFRVADGSTLTIKDSQGGGTLTGGWITGNGGAIYVEAGGTLNVNGGTITSCTANASGGAIYNAGTTIINGGTIKTNSSTYGGGIYNQGSLTVTGSTSIEQNSATDGGGIFNANNPSSKLTILGGSITGNSATRYGGGGITSNAMLVLSGGNIEGNTSVAHGSGIWVGYFDTEGSTITIYGTPVIRNNHMQDGTKEDLYLCKGKKIKLSSSLSEGAYISVTCEDDCSVPITEGGESSYVELHPTASADEYIHYCDEKYGLIIYNNEVARLEYVNGVNYVDENDQTKTQKCLNMSQLKDADGVSFGLGYNDDKHWFVLNSGKTFNNRLTAVGNVKVIVPNGNTLTANKGIDVPELSSLTVYGQTGQTGKIVATTAGPGLLSYLPGIGSNNGRCGAIRLFGGNIEASGGTLAAGIGGGGSGSVHSIIEIKNATVKATGGAFAPGIGYANANLWEYNAQNQKEDVSPWLYESVITIHSGTVEATGGPSGAGIGSGAFTYFLGTVNIEGGTVTATGNTADSPNVGGAGIGSGAYGSCYLFRYPQAEPMERYAHINISGGKVYANGGDYAAGIGGGSWGKDNPDLSDLGTYESFDMPDYTGGGANVVISGGAYVKAIASEEGGSEAIGHGGHVDDYDTPPTSGSVSLYDEACVSLSDQPLALAVAGERTTKLRSQMVIVEPCSHWANDLACYIVDGTRHSGCQYCLAESKMSNHTFGQWGQCACGLIALYDLQPNSETIRHWTEVEDGETSRNVVLSGRTLYRNSLWNTLCLPFDLNKEETKNFLNPGALMTLDKSVFDPSEGMLTLNFKGEEKVEHGKPYIIKWDKEVGVDEEWANPVFKDVKLQKGWGATLDDYTMFTSTFDPIIYTIEDGPQTSILFLSSQTRYDSGVDVVESTLFYPDGNAPTTIGAFRAYFILQGALHAGEAETGEPDFVRSFNLNFGDGEQTAIDSAPSTANGTERTVSTYDLQGRRIAGPEAKPLKKGIYISGGRKVMVK